MSTVARFAARALEADIAPILPTRSRLGGFVYFVLCESPDYQVKIGHAKNLASRLSSAQTDCPYRLRVVAFLQDADPPSVEQQLHDHFRADHIRGEWFRMSGEILDLIIKIRREHQGAFERIYEVAR